MWSSRYPPCNGYGFEEDDEVLVLFEGHDRSSPKVVGFRRALAIATVGKTGCNFKETRSPH